MTRVAVVTGGTRGIGAAVSKALKAAGYHVAATYHSNDEAAEKFKAETGVHVYKWNVVNYDDCVDGLGRVEKELGPIDVLVNNAASYGGDPERIFVGGHSAGGHLGALRSGMLPVRPENPVDQVRGLVRVSHDLAWVAFP